MKHVIPFGALAGIGLIAALVGCSGTAETNGNGEAGSGGASTIPTGGAGGKLGSAGSSSSAGNGGQGGHSAGAGGASNSAGAGGASNSAGTGGASSTGKPCGGFLGNTCSASEYCAYTPGQACGAADASSTCQPRPSACPDIYMPVCGCDNKTYSSTCDAATNGEGVMALGACASTSN